MHIKGLYTCSTKIVGGAKRSAVYAAIIPLCTMVKQSRDCIVMKSEFMADSRIKLKANDDIYEIAKKRESFCSHRNSEILCRKVMPTSTKIFQV